MKPAFAGEVFVEFSADGQAFVFGDGMLLRAGGRYMAAFVPIAADESPDEEEVLPRRHRLSNLAAMLCKDGRFRGYLLGNSAFSEEAAAKRLCEKLGISSRAELDSNRQAALRFWEIRRGFDGEDTGRQGDGSPA